MDKPVLVVVAVRSDGQRVTIALPDDSRSSLSLIELFVLWLRRLAGGRST